MLKKDRQGKHGGHPTILSRWYIILYDRIALETHINKADEHLARTQQKYRDIPRSQQLRQRKGQQSEGHEELDYAVDPNTGWIFYRQSRGNLRTSASGSRANLQAASSSSSTWTKLSGRQAIGIFRILQVLTGGEFFLTVRTGFGCLEKHFQPTDGGWCEQYTTNTARTELHTT